MLKKPLNHKEEKYKKDKKIKNQKPHKSMMQQNKTIFLQL